MISRRSSFKAAFAAVTAATVARRARAEDKVLKVGISLSLTGADAADASRIAYGAILAFDDANAAHTVPGYTFQYVKLDDATPTAGQYDPAQAATNARTMVADRAYVAAIGPQMSGSGKAMAPILSTGNLPIITPSATNPDLTDPKFGSQFRPGGKPVFFRTVATDAYQGPNMANYMADALKVKTVYVLDDSGAYGVGLADAFQRQAERKGMKVVGRDRLDPKAADYASVLTKIKSLNPDGLYYGGVSQAGVKLAKQGYDIIPKVIKAGGDGVWSADWLKGSGFPAAEGWYATQAAPHVGDDPKAKQFSERYFQRFAVHPDDYSITAYVAAQVIVAAAQAAAKSGKPVDRAAIRDAIQNVSLQDTLLGPVAFDANGDLQNKIISVFKVTKDTSSPLDDAAAQFKYVGVAPTS